MKKMKDLVISVFETGKIPMHAANSSTRFWVYADLKGNNVMIQPHKFLRVPIGFKARMPKSWIGMAFLSPRLIFEKGLQTVSSLPIIDSAEGDEWAIYVYNNSDCTQILEHDEKVAQIVFFKAKECKLLPFLDKGDQDFGIAGNPTEV